MSAKGETPRDRLLDVETVSSLTTYSPSALRTRRHRKQRPLSFKLGGKVVYRESEVLAWIDEAAQAEADAS